jgi:hypothetical protein
MSRSRRLRGGTPTRKKETKTPKSKTPRTTVTTSKKGKGHKKRSRLGQYRAKKGEFGWMGAKK